MPDVYHLVVESKSGLSDDIPLHITTFRSRTVYLLGSRRISSELLKAIYYRIHLFFTSLFAYLYRIIFFIFLQKYQVSMCFFYIFHIGVLIYF